ncbi:MAG: glutaredoxin domain-containing protein [Candidatus Falkowbacteria bacterium]
MKKNFIVFTLLLFLGFSLSACSLNSKLNNSASATKVSDAKLVLYYSTTCPHCKIVEQYMDENKIQAKSGIVMKEVSGDKANAQELVAKAVTCNISQNDLGVPFLWNDGKCLVGDKDIVDFFKTQYK